MRGTEPAAIDLTLRHWRVEMGHHRGARRYFWPFAWAADFIGKPHPPGRTMQDDSESQIKLRYGLNPQQGGARLIARSGVCPVAVLCGSPSSINVLDALKGWQLVRELKRRFGKPAAASYKHANPAGAGLGADALDEGYRRAHFLRDWALSPLAIAYLRARHADGISSYGDFVALSDVVDIETALILKSVASDGVIAPGFAPDAFAALQGKRNGKFVVLTIDPTYEPEGPDIRSEFGLTLIQERDMSEVVSPGTERIVTANITLSKTVSETLLMALIVARHTQSNAVVISADGCTVGIGAGQQSRIAATRIACEKAEIYLLLDHPKVAGLDFKPASRRIERINAVDQFLRFDSLSEREQASFAAQLDSDFTPLTQSERIAWIQSKRPLCAASDAFIPFADNIDRMAQAGVTHVMQTGGSIRDQDVTAAADLHGMVMLHTGRRYFLH